MGGTTETRLRQRFLNNLGLHTCCTEIILHCVSASNQLQQWTNFCTNFFSPKSGGVGDASRLSKKAGGYAVPPPHYTAAVQTRRRRPGAGRCASLCANPSDTCASDACPTSPSPRCCTGELAVSPSREQRPPRPRLPDRPRKGRPNSRHRRRRRRRHRHPLREHRYSVST